MDYLQTPKPAPHITIPASSSTVTVRVIDSLESLWLDGDGLFWTPKIQGFTGVEAPVFCFLISNGDRHIIFDLGVRRDWDKYAPGIASLIKKTTKVKIDKNVADIVEDEGKDIGVSSQNVEAIVWSHTHFDHIGDPSTFPTSTDLVVGHGAKDQCRPAYPSKPDASLLDSDTEGRNVREVDIKAEGRGLKIGQFDAFDYFGDGSFYLLDAPGHSVGHMCGFARVTSSPDSFVFMGADAAHHAGLLRPSEYLPLPSTILPSPVPRYGAKGCPGPLLQQKHPSNSADTPFLEPSFKMFPEYQLAQETIEKIKELDADDRIFVVLCHDESLKGHIDVFPGAINDWKAQDLKERTRWLFCKDFLRRQQLDSGPRRRTFRGRE